MATFEQRATVRPTHDEMSAAAAVGCLRQKEARLAGKRESHGRRDGAGDRGGLSAAWMNHIEGAMGEMAFAKFAGLHWDAPVNTYKSGGDVGLIQVRTRVGEGPNRYCRDLIIRNADATESVYVQVVWWDHEAFDVVGWCVVGDVRRECFRSAWYKSYTPGRTDLAWFIPDSALRPMSEFPRHAYSGPHGLPPGAGIAAPGPDPLRPYPQSRPKI